MTKKNAPAKSMDKSSAVWSVIKLIHVRNRNARRLLIGENLGQVNKLGGDDVAVQ